jgi:hypothetical protein
MRPAQILIRTLTVCFCPEFSLEDTKVLLTTGSRIHGWNRNQTSCNPALSVPVIPEQTRYLLSGPRRDPCWRTRLHSRPGWAEPRPKQGLNTIFLLILSCPLEAEYDLSDFNVFCLKTSCWVSDFGTTILVFLETFFITKAIGTGYRTGNNCLNYKEAKSSCP